MLGCWARDHTLNNKASDLSGGLALLRTGACPREQVCLSSTGPVLLFIKTHCWFA